MRSSKTLAGMLAAAAAALTSYASGESSLSIQLRSSAFESGGHIPRQYTEDGDDVSPPLSWENVPQGTKELAIVCDDPDAPSKEPWVHWVIYKIPPDTRRLSEGVAPVERPEKPEGAVQGRNSWTAGRTIGYRGPAPPPGKPHHYRFHIYALDAALQLRPELTKNQLERAMRGHVLAEGELVGTYGR